MGIIAPAWYFAPQRNQVAEAGWKTAALGSGVFGDGSIAGLDQPAMATMLLQLAGEFADPETKQRIWDAADEHIEPTWNHDTGEFTLGLGLNEAHPRGQWNARMMAGWVCTQGAWSGIFNEPNLTKFSEPTVEGVDFPRIALSEAKWDGQVLHLAAHPQNTAIEGTSTMVKLRNVDSTDGWNMTQSNGEKVQLVGKGDHVEIELVADNRVVTVYRSTMTPSRT
ncbi:MAG: hypothetical protein ABGY96_18220 [bacterium]|nr:hypothetical protein [Gammaproteobacteria bacterium]HIL95984.1 hypothetical protein [Pseudomonadales bacterium]